MIFHLKKLQKQILAFLESVDDCYVFSVLSSHRLKAQGLWFVYKGKAYYVKTLRNHRATVFLDYKKGILHPELASMAKSGVNIILTYSLDEFVRFFLDEVALA